jgi:hypothetical protein
MAFTVGAVAAKDGAGTTITGGLLALDQTGSGPWIIVHSLVDGVAGVNRMGIYVEDIAAAADPQAPMLMAVRRDTLSTTEVSADGDNIAIKATNKGQLHVLAEITGAQLSSLQTTSQVMSAGFQLVGLPSDQVKIPIHGNTAHDLADADKPIKGGFKATTSLAGLTLVSNADVTDAFSGIDGVQIVRPHSNLEDIVTGGPATDTAGASTQCIAAQAAGIKTYLTSVILCNTSAIAVTVIVKDGTTSKLTLPLPAGSGCIYNPPVPIPGTAATAWNFHPSTAATTITCSMVGFKSKV